MCEHLPSTSALTVKIFLQVLGVEFPIAPGADASDFALLYPNI